MAKFRQRIIFTSNMREKYCYVFNFLKTCQYQFVNCKKSKNKQAVQFQLNSPHCPHYYMCHCSNLYHIYNNNFNNNSLDRYPYHTTIRQTFTTAIFKPRLFIYTQLHTRLTELLLTLACFVGAFYVRTSSVCGMFSKQNFRVLAFSETL